MNGALETYKLGEGVSCYADSMKKNIDGKLDFFGKEIEKILGERKCDEPLEVLDVGCCSGTLASGIKDLFLANVNVSGVDISNKMIEIAREKHTGEFYTDNGYSLDNTKSLSKDVITYSSILHELGSYYESDDDKKDEETYREGIKSGLLAAYRVLRKGGYLLIKDPVKPISPKEELSLKVKGSNKRTLDGGNSLVDLSTLSLNDLLNLCNEINITNNFDHVTRTLFFLKGFGWLSKNIRSLDENIWNGEVLTLTRDVASEVARHVPLGDNIGHFTDEQKEWYGSFNINEWISVLESSQEVGFELLEHEAVFKSSNHASWLGKQFELFDQGGNKLHHKDILPTHQFTVLRKK